MTSSQSQTGLLDIPKLRSDFPILDQQVHRGKPLIYLDNAASTQRPRQVIEAMQACYESTYANVHRGTHWLSQEASRLYEQARIAVQQFIGAQWIDEVIFTSGTTLGINTVARSWGDQHVQQDDEILLTLMEHHSNIVPWQQLAERVGAKIRWVGLTDDGRLDWDDLDQKLTSRTKLFAFSATSNTLGTINPVRELVARAQAVGATVLVDAAQHVPHDLTQVETWDADFVVFSGHKMLGPTGIGILYGKQALLQEMPAFLGGGSMIKTVTTSGFTAGDLPAKFEAGTPPIVETIGLAAAIDYLQAVGLPAIAAHEKKLAAHCRQRLLEIPDIRVLGPAADHTTGIVSFAVDQVSAYDIGQMIDFQGVAIRAGHHCTMPLHDHLQIPASCRASFYLYNTLEEVDQFVDALQHVLPKLK